MSCAADRGKRPRKVAISGINDLAIVKTYGIPINDQNHGRTIERPPERFGNV